MPWAVAAAAVTAIGGNVAANKQKRAAEGAAQASLDAANIQVDRSQEASALLDPFQGIGQQGLDQAGFLTDPQAQFDFLQNNPLFQLSLDNANTQTQQLAASRGRLSSGDTLQQLSNNVLLSASPLIQGQKQSIGNLLNFGQNAAANQGSLLTGQGAALAGGIVGQANARTAGADIGAQNINNIAGILSGVLANQGG